MLVKFYCVWVRSANDDGHEATKHQLSTRTAFACDLRAQETFVYILYEQDERRRRDGKPQFQ